MSADDGATSGSKENRILFDSESTARAELGNARRICPEADYKLVRLIPASRNLRLKRKLLADSIVFDERAGFVAQSPEKWWHAGYARALRDVAGQL